MAGADLMAFLDPDDDTCRNHGQNPADADDFGKQEDHEGQGDVEEDVEDIRAQFGLVDKLEDEDGEEAQGNA